MSRAITLLVAAGLGLFASGIAAAAPKAEKPAEKSTCRAGVGRPVCCKAYVADHCTYVSCCEVGNAGFFSQKLCPKCADHKAKAELACASKGAGTKDACASKGTGAKHECGRCHECSEGGNRAFFTGTNGASCCSSSPKAAKGACCGAKGK
jgi:hypothetical protein